MPKRYSKPQNRQAVYNLIVDEIEILKSELESLRTIIQLSPDFNEQDELWHNIEYDRYSHIVKAIRNMVDPSGGKDDNTSDAIRYINNYTTIDDFYENLISNEYGALNYDMNDKTMNQYSSYSSKDDFITDEEFDIRLNWIKELENKREYLEYFMLDYIK